MKATATRLVLLGLAAAWGALLVITGPRPALLLFTPAQLC